MEARRRQKSEVVTYVPEHGGIIVQDVRSAARLHRCALLSPPGTSLTLNLVGLINGETAEATAAALARFVALEHLTLRFSFVDECAAAVIGGGLMQCRRIEHITVAIDHRTDPFNDSALVMLREAGQRLEGLERLQVRGDYVAGVGVEVLADVLRESASLQRLELPDLGGHGAGPTLCAGIRASCSLTFLSLGSAADEGGYTAIGRELERNTLLTELHLGAVDLAGGTAAAIAKGLAHNGTLQWLVLTARHIAAEGLAALVRALEHNDTLQWLGLESSAIDDEGAAALGLLLKTNKSLQGLKLRASAISDTGAAAIAEGLAYNASLVALDLSSNKIGAEGAAALGHALRHNRCLERLYLRDNRLEDKGAMALVGSLAKNNVLHVLTIDACHLWGMEGLRALGEALETNSALLVLRLAAFLPLEVQVSLDVNLLFCGLPLPQQAELSKLRSWFPHVGDRAPGQLFVVRHRSTLASLFTTLAVATSGARQPPEGGAQRSWQPSLPPPLVSDLLFSVSRILRQRDIITRCVSAGVD